jgi:Cu/Ag efflux pump CusA
MAVGVFLPLQAVRERRPATLTFVTLPAAVVGGLLLGLVAGGGSLTLGVLVGLLAVLAIAARNGMVLILHLQQRAGSAEDGLHIEPIVRGAGERFGPVILTALATAVAVAPFLVLGDLPGLEVVWPMAAAIPAAS